MDIYFVVKGNRISRRIGVTKTYSISQASERVRVLVCNKILIPAIQMANFTEVLHCRENSVTAHSRQDECELGERLKHRQNARYCIAFKIESLNYPSVQHADGLIHSHSFIMVVKLNQCFRMFV